MKTAIIVQARMTSTRLPGKVLMDLSGRPMLAQQVRRLKRCREADDIVVATTTNAADDPVVGLAEREGVRWFRGSEHDVLSRYLGAAREVRADVVVRITSDCPLIDPEQSDRVIAELNSAPCDYAANILRRTLPRGLDTEAFFFDVLQRLDRHGSSQPSREHVTHFLLEERPDLFLLRSVEDAEDNSDLRWTVDTPQDLEMVRRLYEGLGMGDRHVPYKEVLAFARARPDIVAINAGVQQKTV